MTIDLPKESRVSFDTTQPSSASMVNLTAKSLDFKNLPDMKKPELTYKVDPQTFVKYMTGRKTEGIGLEGYEVKKPWEKNHHHITTHKLEQNHGPPQDYLSAYMRSKEGIPGPEYLPIRPDDFTSDSNKIHFAIDKADRVTVPEEAQRQKRNIPGSQDYKTDEFSNSILGAAKV